MLDECLELWCAVLFQAFADAAMPPRHNRKSSNILAQREARLWLSHYSHDLERVCDWAGVPPAKILNLGRKLADKNWPEAETKHFAAEHGVTRRARAAWQGLKHKH